jgi:CheY-like chemotaxis protein
MSKLLLVEDDNNLREIYEARLQAEGYSIVTAKDGEEALVVAKAEKPDLIISDIMMPKISGFEMLDILRNTENLKNVPVIMLTALGQNDDQQRADKLGADRYLVKSQVTLEDIVRVAHELLGDSPTPAEPGAPTDQAQAAAPPAATPPTPSPAAAPAPATTDVPAPPPAAVEPVPVTPAPTPAPEPPAPEPVTPPPAAVSTTPDPTTATTPVSTPPADTPQAAPSPLPSDDGAAAAAAATTSAEEGADVDARIEDFVAGASQDATPPDQSETPATSDTPAADATTDVSSTQAEPPVDNAAPADDSTTVDQEPAKEAVPAADAVAPAPAEPSTEASALPAPAEEPSPAAETVAEAPAPTTEPPAPTSSSVVHDKVITPLESDPKKDINTLLALETAKEAGNGMPEPAVAPVVVDDNQTTAPSAPAADSQATSIDATEPTPPNTVITPASDDNGTTDTPEPAAAPAIITSSAATPEPSTEEPGTDLNNIAL